MTLLRFPLPPAPADEDWWTPADDAVLDQERLADAGYFDPDNEEVDA